MENPKSKFLIKLYRYAKWKRDEEEIIFVPFYPASAIVIGHSKKNEEDKHEGSK